MTRILFICHGNICRSPMAEFIMKHIVRAKGLENEFVINSAAVSYEEQGNGMYPPAARKLKEHGIAFGEHRAHRIMPDEAAGYDMLIIMDSSNERLLRRIISARDSEKIHYLMEYAGAADTRKRIPDVSDPWYTGDFETAYRDILKGCSGLMERIIRQGI